MSTRGTGYLGHCSGDDTWAPNYLSGLGACPSSSPVVVVEATQIPSLFWWIAGGYALFMLLKKR